MRGAQGVQGLKQLVLERGVFIDRFDNHVGLGDRLREDRSGVKLGRHSLGLGGSYHSSPFGV